MSMDAISLAKDFSIFDPSILSEEDKANQRRFPTPKEFVDSVSVGGGDINLDELGKSYTKHYKDYVTKSVGLSPALADAKALAIQNMFFTGKDTTQFNDAWGSILNPQQAQAKAQEQAKVTQSDAGHLDNIARGYYQQSAANFVSSAMNDMAQADSATRVRAGQDWLSNQAANDNSQLVRGGGNQAIDLNNQLSGPLPVDPYGKIAQTNESAAVQNIQQAQTQLDKASALPESKGIAEFSKTDGFFDAAGQLIMNPLDAALPLVEQSLAPMASQLGAAAVGGVVGGIPGAMVAGGATSYEVNRAAKILEEAQKTGRPLIDVVRDAQARGEIQGEASRYATVVGAADALSMGAAGATMPARTLLGRAAMQTGLQAGLGGAGEAGGQIAATGEITSGRDIAAEALLEIPFGAVEVGIAALNRPRTQADRTPPNESSNRQGLGTTTVTPQPIQPNANPLSQFAQQVPQSQAAPQANQQALLPSKAQPHPDDIYYVDQAGRTQYGNPNVPRSFGGYGLTEQAVRGKSIGDLIASGEGDYQSFNRGKAGDAAGEKIDFSQMTVAEVMQRQALPEGNPDRIFTVGKYQAIPETFAEAVQKLGIPADTKVTPALQEYIFSEYLLKDKRPDIRDYITGKSDSLKDAQKAGAMEWAAIADPDTGLSFHGSVGNNKASISSDAFGNSLKSVRQVYANAIAQGSSPDEAWSKAVNAQQSSTPLPVRTSIGFQQVIPANTGNETLSTQVIESDTEQPPTDATPSVQQALPEDFVKFNPEQSALLDEFRKKRTLDDLINQEVDYNGVTGFLVKRDNAFVVIGENSDVLVESGFSGRTSDSLGIRPLGITELALPEKSSVTTNFDTNDISLYGKPYRYVSTNSDETGVTKSINLVDPAGKVRVIRNPELVNLIEAEKIAYELDQRTEDEKRAIRSLSSRLANIQSLSRRDIERNEVPARIQSAASQEPTTRQPDPSVAKQKTIFGVTAADIEAAMRERRGRFETKPEQQNTPATGDISEISRFLAGDPLETFAVDFFNPLASSRAYSTPLSRRGNDSTIVYPKSNTNNKRDSPVQSSPVPVVDIGKKGVIYDADNNEHVASYQVVDAADLSPSQVKAFNQNRDRTRNEAQRQVDSIIKNPVYGRLNMQHSTFTDGAPVLMNDSTIIAGNGRVMGLQGAYKAGTARQYKAQLINDLKAQGVDTTAISQMRSPILVRRLDGKGVNNQPNRMEIINRAGEDARESTASKQGIGSGLRGSNSNTGGQVAGEPANSRLNQSGANGNTGLNSASANPLYNISPRQVNLTGNDTRLTTAWKLIASQDDAFQLPISTKKTLVDIAGDYDPAIKIELRKENKNQRQWVISVPTSKGFQKATVTEGKGRDKTVYLDISEFSTGSGGRTVYQMIGDYAHNTGKVFIGDPNGLSAIAQIRRTENMLSSALRWGTTDHLQPHELQLKPDSSKVTPLQWKVGNTEFNIDQMLRASMGNLLNQIPELGQVRYNFESQQFEETLPNGRIDTVTEADFGELAKSRGARATQAGRTTLKRAVVSASILSGQGQAAWNAVLGNLIRQSGQQLDNPLQGILYGLNPSLDQIVNQVATDKQLSDLAEDALLSVFGESPKNQAIADRLLRQFFFDNFVQSETYPDSRSFVTARMNELRSSGALKLISDQYFSGNTSFKLKDDASRKPISAEKAEAAIRRILGDISFETTIPDEIRSGAGDAAERVKGAFANGKIYIDTSNIGSVAEAEALAIEELVHRGVANLFGPDYDARLMALYEAIGGEAGIRRFISQHKIEMADDYFNQSPQAQMDELLAHIEANQSTLTVRVKRAFQRLIAHLRNAIRKLNTKVLHNVSDSDIILIARNARNAAQDAVNSPMNDPRFGIRPEKESAELNEQERIRNEFNDRPKLDSSERVKRYIASGKQSLNDRYYATKDALFTTDSDFKTEFSNWVKRNFYSDSTLGRTIADARRGIDWTRAATHDQVISDVVLLEAMVKNIYGKSRSDLSTLEQEQFHRVITGQEEFANQSYQEQIQYFRLRIDNASQQLINEKYREMTMRINELNDDGKLALNDIAADLLAGNDNVPVPPVLAQIAKLQRQINTIEANKGAYLNRAYQAFTDPRWPKKIRKEPIFKEAVSFVIKQRAQQIKESLDGDIAESLLSIDKIKSRQSKLVALQEELVANNKKRSFRVGKLQQLRQIPTNNFSTEELAKHNRRITTTSKELDELNAENARLTKRIDTITSGNFKLDKNELDRIASHYRSINQMQVEKTSVDNGKHPNLLNQEQATGILNQWLESATSHGSMIEFSSGQGTNEGILKRRKDIPPILRELLGEFKDPVFNYANTITQVADYVAKQQYQMTLRQLLLSMPNIAFIGKEPEGMKVANFPENAAYSALNDLYVDADFMRDLKEFGVIDDMKNPLMQWTIQLSAAVKLGKTVLSPTTAMRNFWSGFMLLSAAGYSPFGGMKDALSVIQNAKNRMGFLSGDLILNTQEAEQLNQRYVRLGIRRDGASSGELAGIFRDFHKADQAVKEQGLARKAFNNALAFYQFGDDFFKIIHFEKGYADLLDTGIPPLEAEQEAARRTRDTMPTYSMVPKALQQLRRFPLIGTFVSFPWEVMRTLKNSLDLIIHDRKMAKETGNSKWNTMANKRIIGLTVAYALPTIVALWSRALAGIDDDDNEALDHFSSDWRKGQLRLYMGGDANNLRYLDLTPLVPSEYIMRSLRIGVQRGSDQGIWSGLFNTGREMGKPFYSFDISTKGIYNLFTNRDDNGRPIYGEGKTMVDLLAQPGENSPHLGEALSYMAKQFGPGIIQNVNDFNRALSGSVADADNGSGLVSDFINERAASIGGKISRSGKEFNLNDAIAALVGFRMTDQNMIVLGQQAANQTRDKAASYSAEFKLAVDVTTPLSNEFLDRRLQQVINDRTRAFSKMIDLAQYYRRKGMTDQEIAVNLYGKEGKTHPMSKATIASIIKGETPTFEVSKEVMSNSLRSIEMIEDPRNRLQAKRALAERYRYLQQRAAELQQQTVTAP